MISLATAFQSKSIFYREKERERKNATCTSTLPAGSRQVIAHMKSTCNTLDVTQSTNQLIVRAINYLWLHGYTVSCYVSPLNYASLALHMILLVYVSVC